MKTVRVRIAVAVDQKGRWAAVGYSEWPDATTIPSLFIDEMDKGETYHWIEADVPAPEPMVIEGEVKS